MDKNGERVACKNWNVYSPQRQNNLIFFWLPYSGLGKAVAGIYPGCAMQLDALDPPRPFASVRFDPLAWSSGSDQRRISGCGIRWLLAGPDSLPLWLCHGVCAFVLLRCFSCSHTVLPKEHSLGVIFFSSLSSCKCCIFLQFYLHFTTDYTCMIVYVTNNKEPWTLMTHPNNLQGYTKQRCVVEVGSKQLFTYAFSSSRKFSTRSSPFLTCIWMQIKWKLSVENYYTDKLSCCGERESTAKLYPLQFTSKKCKI